MSISNHHWPPRTMSPSNCMGSPQQLQRSCCISAPDSGPAGVRPSSGSKEARKASAEEMDDESRAFSLGQLRVGPGPGCQGQAAKARLPRSGGQGPNNQRPWQLLTLRVSDFYQLQGLQLSQGVELLGPRLFLPATATLVTNLAKGGSTKKCPGIVNSYSYNGDDTKKSRNMTNYVSYQANYQFRWTSLLCAHWYLPLVEHG